MTSPDVSKDGSSTVIFIDPVTQQEVYSVSEKDTLSPTFNKKYLDRTLEEVMP